MTHKLANIHQSWLCPCSDLCLLGNPCLVYFNPQELRPSRSHRLKLPDTEWLYSIPQGHHWGEEHYQTALRAGQPDFLCRLSVQPSVSGSPTACMSVLHHCAVMMNRRPTKRRRAGEGGGEEKEIMLCLFIALFHHGNNLIYSENFSIHLLLSPAKPIFYVHQCVCLCGSVCCQENRGKAGSSLFVTTTERATF